jgi:ATP phosphoribosyltransferase
MRNEPLTLGIPKGSLQELTLNLFSRAGFSFSGSGRSLWLSSNDSEIRPVLLKPQEIPSFVKSGTLDCGLSGLDWITEMGCADQVRILADLCYSKRSFRPVRWVLAVPRDAKYETPADLEGKRISTELKKITGDWLAGQRILAEVDFSWGATEAKVPHFADAIVECTETGASLIENGLRILDTVFESTTQFFSNKALYKTAGWKREKLDAIALLLKSCLNADVKVSIQARIPEAAQSALIRLLPLDAGVSFWQGHNNETLVEIIVNKEQSRELIPLLARQGAGRISVHALGILYDQSVK